MDAPPIGEPATPALDADRAEPGPAAEPAFLLPPPAGARGALHPPLNTALDAAPGRTVGRMLGLDMSGIAGGRPQRRVSLATPRRPPLGSVLLVPPRRRRLTLRPGPDALVANGRRRYPQARFDRATAVLPRDTAERGLVLDPDAPRTEEASERRATDGPPRSEPLRPSAGAARGGLRTLAVSDPDAAHIPELDEAVASGIVGPPEPLVEGQDYVLVRPPGCPDGEPVRRVVLLDTRGADRVHPTAREPIQDFLVVGWDVTDFEPTDPTGAPWSLQALDERIMQIMLDSAMPNGTVSIRSGDGRLVYAKSFTWVTWYDAWFRDYDLSQLPGGEHLAHLQRPGHRNRIPVTTPCSKFQWASVSKPMTAVLALQLAEEAGQPDSDLRFSLDDPVFPNVPRQPWRQWFRDHGSQFWRRSSGGTGVVTEGGIDLRRIKIHHLLTHTCGWSNDHETDPDGNAVPAGLTRTQAAELGAQQQRRTWPIDQDTVFRAQFSDEPGSIATQLRSGAAFPAGTVKLYSNTGYMLLSRILTYVGGDTFYRLLGDRIFSRCGMSGARVLLRGGLRARQPGDALWFSKYRQDDPHPDRWREELVEDKGFDFSEGWAWGERSRLDSVARDDSETSAYDPFPGVGDWVWQPYGARDKALASGSSSVVASSIDVTRFGAAVRRDDPSPVLGPLWLWLLWAYGEPLLPFDESQATTLGFRRSDDELFHNGATIGGSSRLSILAPNTDSESARWGGMPTEPPVDIGGLVVAASFNRANEYEHYNGWMEEWIESDLPTWQSGLISYVRRTAIARVLTGSTADLETHYA